jgi:hypothetical protein
MNKDNMGWLVAIIIGLSLLSSILLSIFPHAKQNTEGIDCQKIGGKYIIVREEPSLHGLIKIYGCVMEE